MEQFPFYVSFRKACRDVSQLCGSCKRGIWTDDRSRMVSADCGGSGKHYPPQSQASGKRGCFPDVLDIYTGSKEIFRDRIRNERTVELAFEGHRFIDMRRWYIAHTQEYKVRYAAEFDKEHTYYNEVKLFEGPFDEKHYWFPFKPSDTQQYEGFKQNPGW